MITGKECQHTMLLHDAQELDDHFRARSDHHLALPSFLGVVDAFQRVIEDGGFDHVGGVERLVGETVNEILKSRAQGLEVSARPLQVSLQ
jgi:hypothetical protein